MALKAVKRNWPWKSKRREAGVTVAQVNELLSLIFLIVSTHKSKETVAVGESGNSAGSESLDFPLGIKEIAPGVSPVAE
jgi:hypothetical protein